MKKITNREEVEKLYREGKISSTTLWRFKKRGYIMLGWQKPHKQSTLSVHEVWELVLSLQKAITAIAWYQAKAIITEYYTKETIDDIVQDTLIHLVERRQSEYHLVVAKTYIIYRLKRIAHQKRCLEKIKNRYIQSKIEEKA